MPEQLTAILQTIQSIPEGRLSSYGRIAAAAGYPGCARYVGFALKNLPSSTTLPWHRVVNSQGKIAFPKSSDKHREQRQRLMSEGHPKLLTTSHFKSVVWPSA